MQLINILCKLAHFIILKKMLFSTVSADYIFCYYSEKYKVNLFIFSLLLSGMISTCTLHKFIKAFPREFSPHVYHVVSVSC